MGAPEEKVMGSFSPKDLQQLNNLSELYIQAKGLILYSEEVDPNSRSNLQVIKELRDSHDHIMRVVSIRLTPSIAEGKDLPIDYCEKNLEKAIGHVYRAAFDALDGTIVSLRQKVSDILAKYPTDVTSEVVPDYWVIRIKLEELTATIASHRANKDVGGAIERTLDEYVADVESIKDFYKKLLHAGPALDECLKKKHAEEEAERQKHRADHIFSGITYSIILAVGGVLVGAVATYFGFSSKPAVEKPQAYSSPPLAESPIKKQVLQPKAPIQSNGSK